MDIVIINGSYRKGNTFKLTKMIADELQNINQDVNFEYVHLKDYDIDYCRSCHQCFLKGDRACKDSANIIMINHWPRAPSVLPAHLDRSYPHQSF